jgi:Zn-dependent peptidase ImmA (M78 family)/DNA-binding XRE family transcriptional regulator
VPNLPSIDPKNLGHRLAEARKARGLTQQDVADYLKCSRPTLIAIEKGTRAAKPEEIIALAELYGRKVHDLVRPGEPVRGFQPHLRAAAGKAEPGNEELEKAVESLHQFAENYRELESLLNAPMTYNYPQEIRLSGRIEVRTLAEDTATRERSRLGLGNQPIGDLRELLECEIGLRIMYGNLPSRIAGLYAYAGDVGCCILINRKHPEERRRASLAHEYGHVIVDRYKPGVDYLRFRGAKPISERFVEAFGMSFLMPATSVRRHFHDIISLNGDFQVADLCRLSHLYYTSVEAMAYRLEELELIPTGTVAHLRESRFGVKKAKDALELPEQKKMDTKFPDRYVYLAVKAYEQARISEGQLARFLDVDPVGAREIAELRSQDTHVTDDGKIESYRVDWHQSLFTK